MKKLLFLLFSVFHLVAFAQQIVESQYIFSPKDFASVHASTIVELQNGDILIAFFAGSYEGCDDVCIWMSRKDNGTDFWTVPTVIANGGPTKQSIKNNILTENKACYNPVLYQMPNGNIILFFKIGKFVQDWSGWYSISTDNGYTWSEKQPLKENYLGPIKNKPILVENQLVCPSSVEKGGWRIHFENYNLNTNTWTYIDNISSDSAVRTVNMPNGTKEPIGAIQPTIITLPNGILQALCRTQNGRVASTKSYDKGLSWGKLYLTDIPNNNSGLDAVTLQDGRQAVVLNDVQTPEGKDAGERSPLVLLIYSPNMQTMENRIILENEPNCEFSYPSVIQSKTGDILIVYTWKRQRIVFKKISLEEK